MKKENPEVDRQLVKHLRSRADMTQDAFGRAAGVDQRDVSRYELGHETPTEEVLRRMATAAGLPWPVVVSLRRIFAAAQSAVARAKSIPRLASTATIEETILDSVLLAVTPYLVEERMAEPDRPTPEEALREADEIWTALAGFPPERRRRLIELSPRPSGNVALARRICDASAEAATRSAAEVAELADLARFTALRVPEGGARRARAEGFCLGFVANAHRVATDFEAADTALAQAWSLWRAAEPAEPELLPEWRLHDLEASLRRAQRRFPEALECLDRALALCGGQPAAVGHILLNKEHLFDAMGDAEKALAALEEAAPLVEAAGDPRLLFALRFNMADHLGHLDRYAEAESLLPEVSTLAVGKLDRLRVTWLSARVSAGLGRQEEARGLFREVMQSFIAEALPYEAALASLDLAVLYLKEGRTAEVQELAGAMGGIFEAKGIAREALAALALFCEAAKQEAATVELAKRVIAELERARR